MMIILESNDMLKIFTDIGSVILYAVVLGIIFIVGILFVTTITATSFAVHYGAKSAKSQNSKIVDSEETVIFDNIIFKKNSQVDMLRFLILCFERKIVNRRKLKKAIEEMLYNTVVDKKNRSFIA